MEKRKKVAEDSTIEDRDVNEIISEAQKKADEIISNTVRDVYEICTDANKKVNKNIEELIEIIKNPIYEKRIMKILQNAKKINRITTIVKRNFDQIVSEVETTKSTKDAEADAIGNSTNAEDETPENSTVIADKKGAENIVKIESVFECVTDTEIKSTENSTKTDVEAAKNTMGEDEIAAGKFTDGKTDAKHETAASSTEIGGEATKNTAATETEVDEIISKAKAEAAKIVSEANKVASEIVSNAEINAECKALSESINDLGKMVLKSSQQSLVEVENLKKSIFEKDVSILIKYIGEIENFQEKLEKDSVSASEILKYVKHLQREFIKILKKWGVHEFIPIEGEQFNPEKHELETTEPDYENKVISDVLRPGYMRSEYILRLALVTLKTEI